MSVTLYNGPSPTCSDCCCCCYCCLASILNETISVPKRIQTNAKRIKTWFQLFPMGLQQDPQCGQVSIIDIRSKKGCFLYFLYNRCWLSHSPMWRRKVVGKSVLRQVSQVHATSVPKWRINQSQHTTQFNSESRTNKHRNKKWSSRAENNDTPEPSEHC